MKNIILGIMLMLAALWGGAWMMNEIGYDHWAGFPAYMTSVAVFFVGFGVMAYGIEQTVRAGA